LTESKAPFALSATAPAADATRVSIEVPVVPPAQDTAATPQPAIPAAPASPAPPAPSAETPAPLEARQPGLRALVIDPGHGGDDAGVHGPAEALEKQLTLEIARRLKGLIETRLGVRVVMTRDDDRAVTLDERDSIANNSKADLFISIHVNGSLASKVAGAEVYSMQLDREGEDAKRDAAASEVVLPTVGGGSRTINVIRWDLAQAPHVDASAAFASMLEEELRKHVPMGPLPLQQEPMRVLAGANMPAALVEVGYLTNPAQAKEIQSDNFQNLVAQALYDAVLRFRGYLETVQAR